MTTNTAASALSGSASPAGASDPTAGTGATGNVDPGTVTGTGNSAPSGDWYSGIQDEGVRNWVQAKGFKDPVSAAESAYNLEKMIGFDRAGRTVVVPDENSTPEQIKAFNTRMGVPETADGYTLPVPEGQDAAFSKQAAQWMHEAGISAKAGEALATKWNEHIAGIQAKAEQEFQAKSSADFDALRSEWGNAFNQNSELAKRAAAQFIPGSADERGKVIDGLERVMGTANLMKMFAAIGSGLGEHSLHQGDGGMMTPAQANQRIAELKSNSEWTNAYLGGDQAKARELQQLIAMANPGS